MPTTAPWWSDEARRRYALSLGAPGYPLFAPAEQCGRDRSARVRATHFLDRGLDSPPISGLMLLTLLLAFGSPLGGLQFGLVAMRADKALRSFAP